MHYPFGLALKLGSLSARVPSYLSRADDRSHVEVSALVIKIVGETVRARGDYSTE